MRLSFSLVILLFTCSLSAQNCVTSVTLEENNVSGGGFQSDVTITDDGLTIYSSADVSGIFKSIDGGLIYHNINEGLKSPKVASLAITPDNEDVLYAGTGDKGGSGGLFRSTDAGDTWVETGAGSSAQFAGNHSATSDPVPNGHPRSNGDLIVVIPGTQQATHTDDVVIAGTYKAGVRIFTQGGDVLADVVNGSGFVRSVAYDASKPNTAYAAIYFANTALNGIYEIDFSDPFSAISTLAYQTPLPEGLTVLSSGNVYAAIGENGIVKYNGSTWSTVNTGLDIGNNLRQWTAVTGYVRNNTDIVYIGLNNLGGNANGTNYSSIWRSTNGGTAWNSLVDVSNNVSDMIYGQTNDWWYRVDGFQQGGLGRTNSVVSSIEVTSGSNIQSISDDVIYVSGRGGIWRSVDGGSNWNPAVHNMAATANEGVAVNPNSPGQVAIANTDYVLLETSTRFETDDISRDKPPGADSRAYDIIFDTKADEIIVGAGDRDHNLAGGVYFKSAPALGSSNGWTDTNLNAILDKRVRAISYGYHDGNAGTNRVILAAVEDAGVYRYFNGTWSYTGLFIGDTERSNFIWPDNENSGVVYLLDIEEGFFRSNDGGQSWTNIWPSMSFNNNDFFNAGYLTADDNDPTTVYLSLQGRSGSPIGTSFKVYRMTNAHTGTFGAPGTAGITDITFHSGSTSIKRPGPIVFGPDGFLWLTEQQNTPGSTTAGLFVMENPTTDASFKDVTTNEYRNIAIVPSGIDVASDGHIYISQTGTGLVKLSYECASSASYDFGDLPDTSAGTSTENYKTTTSDNGPSHLIVSGLSLGSIVDEEADGLQSTDALGDGVDEDAFHFPATTNIAAGGVLNIPIDVVNTTGTVAYYKVWIDWNGDGDFNDANELVANLSDDGAGDFGQNYFTVNIPTNAITDQVIGFRARLSYANNMNTNGQVDSGEVEDYLIEVSCKNPVCLPVEVIIK